MAYTGPSIVDYLASVGQASDYASRAKLAASKGITGYSGSAEQNTQLLGMLRAPASPTTAPVSPTTTPSSSAFFPPPQVGSFSTGMANSTPATMQPITPTISAQGVPSLLPPAPVSSPITSVNGPAVSAGATPVAPGASPVMPSISSVPINPPKPAVSVPVSPQSQASTNAFNANAKAIPNPSAGPVQSGTVGGGVYKPSGPVNPVVGGGSTGGSTGTGGAPAESPFRSAPPAETPEAQKALSLAEAAYAKSLLIGADELSTQEDLDKLIEATKNSYAHIQDQPIMLDFITGQMASVERRALNLAEPLERKLARLQAARQSSMEASKFALERADKAMEAKKNEQFTLGEGQTRYDAFGNVIATGPAKAGGRDTSLTEVNGQRVLVDNQTGEIVSVLGTAKEGSGGDRTLSVTEAMALGVPFGTMASQAYGASPSKPLTEAQGKDLTYASRADQANSVIGSMADTIAGYNSAAWLAAKAAENTTIGNAFVPDEIKQIRQAERNFLTAILRRESGATINPSEFDVAEKQYFPQPGDDAQTLAQKAQLRQTAIASFKTSAGPSAFPSASGGDEYAKYLQAIGQ